MALREWSARHRTATIVIVVALVLLSALGSYLYATSSHQGSGPSQVEVDGPTLYQAYAQVNSSITATPGGPWGVFSYYGIAAQSAFSANVLPYAVSTNLTVNACGAQFQGLTMWNGSMPRFDGSLNSGTAPFWQFAYFSNTTKELLLATDDLGSSKVYPPFPITSVCQPWYDLNEPSPSYWTRLLSSLPANSPVQAVSALTGVDSNWLNEHLPVTEIYTSGPGVFTGLGDRPGSVGVYFDRCGEENVAGVQPIIVAAETFQGKFQGWGNLSVDCNLPKSGYGAYDGLYVIQKTNVVSETTSTMNTVSFTYNVALAYPNGTLTGDDDGWGLANWMTSWNLTTSSDSYLPLGTPNCPAWVPAIGDCVDNSSGWYAVVLSASGEWVDSYGALPGGGAGWSEPVTALVSHQQLVVVAPSSWNLGSDTLNVNSTVATATVLGSLTL
jgi:hypothetical protein